MALYGIPISEDQCIGDSLTTINNSFQNLDARLVGTTASIATLTATSLTNTSFNALSAKATALIASTNTLSSGLERLSMTVETLTATTPTNTSFDALSAKATTLLTSVNALSSSLETLFVLTTSLSAFTLNVGTALENFADDAAALSGGVPLYGYYRNGNVVQQRIS